MNAPAPAISPQGVRFRLRRRPFDRRLAACRVRQRDVAAALGVTRSTVSRWRSGTFSVRGDLALKLAALLNAQFADLFAEEGP